MAGKPVPPSSSFLLSLFLLPLLPSYFLLLPLLLPSPPSSPPPSTSSFILLLLLPPLLPPPLPPRLSPSFLPASSSFVGSFPPDILHPPSSSMYSSPHSSLAWFLIYCANSSLLQSPCRSLGASPGAAAPSLLSLTLARLLAHSQLSHSFILSLSRSLALSRSHGQLLSRSHGQLLSRSHGQLLSRSHALTLSRSHAHPLSGSHSLSLSHNTISLALSRPLSLSSSLPSLPLFLSRSLALSLSLFSLSLHSLAHTLSSLYPSLCPGSSRPRPLRGAIACINVFRLPRLGRDALTTVISRDLWSSCVSGIGSHKPTVPVDLCR